MVVRVWNRHDDFFHRASGHRRGSGIFFHSFIFAGLRDSGLHHEQRAVWSLSARTPLLRRFRHGANDRGAYGANFFVRFLQIPTRDDLVDRRPVTWFHTCHGFYRATAALGSDRSVVGSSSG